MFPGTGSDNNKLSSQCKNDRNEINSITVCEAGICRNSPKPRPPPAPGVLKEWYK